MSVVEWSNPHGSHYTTYQPCTTRTHHCVLSTKKNFNINYLKNNVLLVRPLWLSALHVVCSIMKHQRLLSKHHTAYVRVLLCRMLRVGLLLYDRMTYHYWGATYTKGAKQLNNILEVSIECKYSGCSNKVV